jgi:hypothetical protein
MGYSLEKLNNILFEQLERLSDSELKGDVLEEELKRTDQLVKDEYGYSMAKHMPDLLEVRGNAAKDTKGHR